MKKTLSKFLCLLFTLCMIFSCFIFNASAASTVISFTTPPTVDIGDTVMITVSLRADTEIYGYDFRLDYDSKILEYVSGASSASGDTLKMVGTSENALKKNLNWTIQFTAVKSGDCHFYAETKYSGADGVMVNGGEPAGATLTVAGTTTSEPADSTTPTASNDASLSELKLNTGTISPEFKSDVTEYNVMVGNSIEMVTLEAVASQKDASINGMGEILLEVGDNKYSVKVTAPNKKTVKTYNLTIHRATVEEDAVLNPTAVTIDGKPCHVKADLSEMPVPDGFALSNSTYKDTPVNVFKSENGEYELFIITDDETGREEYYTYKPILDEFTPLHYMTVNEQLVIFTALPDKYYLPMGYYETSTVLGGKETRAFCYEDERYSNIYILSCYANGNDDFYYFDKAETTLQRAYGFELLDEPPVELSGNIIDKFKALESSQKALIYVIAGEALAIIILIIVIAVILKKRDYDDYDDSFLDDDDDMNNFYKTINTTVPMDDEE